MAAVSDLGRAAGLVAIETAVDLATLALGSAITLNLASAGCA